VIGGSRHNHGMRKRSEANSTKTDKKPSAQERTEPLPKPNGPIICSVCEEPTTIEQCSERPNGMHECPSCGAVIDVTLQAKPEAAKATPKIDAPKTEVIIGTKPEVPALTLPVREDLSAPRAPVAPGPVHEPPPKSYCGACGVERPIVQGKIWKQCHEGATDVGDPTRAAQYRPPAGSPVATITGRTLRVTRGKMVFPTVQYGSMTIGAYEMTIELGPDANAVEAARRIRADLKKIAEEAFAEELAWYEEKFRSLQQPGG
jgi:hypothetical protein